MTLSTSKSQIIDDDDLIYFCDEIEQVSPESSEAPGRRGTDTWKIMIIDDDLAVHRATQLALNNFQFAGKSLEFISAYSGEEAKQLITSKQTDIAFILLDVVMETTDAGLQVVRYIREELKNQQVRIVLRTGHPGEAPEESVILNYDINDYKLKVELTRQRMVTTAIAALRSYRDIMTIAQQKLELTHTLERLQQTQDKLGEYAYTLEMKVAERTLALEKANRELFLLANQDGLTGVANRRCFDNYWLQQWQLLAKSQQPLALILLDIDCFKSYNDQYGHLAGDECLQKVAQAINQMLGRPSDLVARYGGEEFAIVLPNTTVEGAAKVSQAITTTVYNLNLQNLQSSVSDRITLSLGISCTVPHQDIAPKLAIAIADKALYQAKEEGRNRYCIYGKPCIPIDL
jgi:diguanylate cyclase (GGDEF)-like protein